MAFVGMGQWAGMGKSSSQFYESLWKIAGVMDKVNKGFKKGITNPKTAKALQGANIVFSKMSNSLKGITTMGFDALGIMLQLGNSMGILQPIMQMLQGVLGIIGGAALGEMGETLKDFAEFLFSSDMIEFWKQLGVMIGDFMSNIMTLIMDLMSDPKVKAFLKHALKILIDFVTYFVIILVTLIRVISTWPKGVLGALIIGLAVLSAFVQGMAALPGIAGVLLGTAMAVLVGIMLAPIAALASGGIVTRPTVALIGEGSEPEIVAPLSKAADFGLGTGGDEVLWATQDNGRRLDRLVMAIEEQNRLKRMKAL